MRADGIADSHEDGLAYLADVVGDIGAPSSPARREMFLTAGYEMINFLIRKGVRSDPVRRAGATTTRITRAATKPAARSRAFPSTPPSWAAGATKSSRSMAKNYGGFVVKTNELRSVQYFNRSPRAFAVATRVFAAHQRRRGLRRREILTNGASLIGQMLKVLIDLRRPAADVDRTPRWKI